MILKHFSLFPILKNYETFSRQIASLIYEMVVELCNRYAPNVYHVLCYVMDQVIAFSCHPMKMALLKKPNEAND